MKINYDFLLPGEQIQMEGSANKQQFLGVNKGGRLILTDRRLVFIAHAINVGSKFDEIPLSQVAVSGKTLNIFCPTPNMIQVTTVDGEKHQFVVSGKQKDKWVQVISELAQGKTVVSGQGYPARSISGPPYAQGKSPLLVFLMVLLILVGIVDTILWGIVGLDLLS